MGTLIQHFERGKRPVKFWKLMGPMFASATIRSTLATLRDEPTTDEWFITTDNSGVTSFACLRVKNSIAELCHHWVREDCRGKSLAKELTDSRMDRAASLGITSLLTIVRQDAVAEFKHRGFAVGKTRGGFVRMVKS